MCWKIYPHKSSVWNIIQPKNILAVLCPWLLLRFLGWVLSDSKKLMGEYLTILTAAQFWAIFPLCQKRVLGKLFGVKPDDASMKLKDGSPVATSIVILPEGVMKCYLFF